MSFSSSISIAFLLILVLKLSSAYIFNGFEISDLAATTAPAFEAELAAWTIGAKDPTKLYSLCSGTPIAGGVNILQGYNTYSERIYTNLPSHNIFYYSFLMVLQDYWAGTDYFAIQFDSKTVMLKDFMVDYTAFSVVQCTGGQSPYSGTIRMYGRIYHTANTLRVRVINYVNGPSSLKSLGFRELTLTFPNTASSLSEMACPRTSTALLVPTCPCNSNQYQDSNGVCHACSSFCSRCFGGSASECYKCSAGKNFDGTTCITCNAACSVCHGTTSDECNACTGSNYLIGYSCLATCPLPLVFDSSASPPTCTYPCKDDEYLFPDSSCSTKCPSPLVPFLKYTIKQFCKSNCGTDYAYFDNYCDPTCPSPFTPIVYHSLKICQPPVCGSRSCTFCNTDADCPQYYHCSMTPLGKGLCMSYITYTLNSELIKTIINGYMVRVEVNPTLDLDEGPNDILTLGIQNLKEQTDYTTSIQKVSKGVFIVTIQITHPIESSLVAQFTYSPELMGLKSELILPQIVYTSPELEKAASAVKTASVISFAVMTVNTIGFVMSGGLATIWSFLPENQYTYYLLYLNMDYTYHTKVYFRSLANYDMLVDLTVPDEDKSTQTDKYYLRILPERFVEEAYSPSFQENAGQVLITLTCIAAAIAIITILFKLLALPRRSYLAHRVLKTLRRVIKWNGLIRQLLTYSLPMALASFIQMHVSLFEEGSSLVSTFLAVISVLILIIGFRIMASLIKNIPTTKFERSVYSEWYGTLWEDLNLDTRYTRYYYLIVSVRGVTLSYVAVFFELYPLGQISILILYQCYIVCLFFWGFKYQKIFETRSLNLATLAEEVLLLVMKGMILASFLLRRHITDNDTLILLGWLIIGPGLITQIIQCLYSTLVQIYEIFQVMKMIRIKVRRFLTRDKVMKKIKRISRNG